jgi:hypothetical protein
MHCPKLKTWPFYLIGAAYYLLLMNWCHQIIPQRISKVNGQLAHAYYSNTVILIFHTAGRCCNVTLPLVNDSISNTRIPPLTRFAHYNFSPITTIHLSQFTHCRKTARCRATHQAAAPAAPAFLQCYCFELM